MSNFNCFVLAETDGDAPVSFLGMQLLAVSAAA